MTSAVTFDPLAFKESQRSDWQLAASGWRLWYDVLEADAAGQVVLRKLVELADLEPGDTVLDVATGCGEPALTAARAVVPSGYVMATDLHPTCSPLGGNAPVGRDSTTSSSGIGRRDAGGS
jgi:predicted nicotinamide N-methyase